jgi:sirohydrochlorin cobaltochelatase
MTESFSDATLVLIGHGSTKNPDSCKPVYQHAAELRRRKIFAEVLEAFWKEPPFIKDVIAAIRTRRIFVVPVFISEGYFTCEAIPSELGFQPPSSSSRFENFPLLEKRGEQTLFYCGPIGTHDSITNVLLARAKDIVEKFPFPRAPKPAETTLFIAGHGTEKNENSRKTIERQVDLIRAKKIYADAHAVFIEEEPRIAECFKLAATKNIILVPFFISDGMHTIEDVPVMLGEPERIVKERLQSGQPTWRNPTEKHGKRLWYTPSIGNEPHISNVILERVQESQSAPQPPQ